MKKAFLIAFAALCAFAAQAVTTSWTSHGTVTNGQSVSISGAATGFSVALVFNLSDISDSSEMNAFLSVLGNTLCYSVGVNANDAPRVGMHYSGSTPTDSTNDWNKDIANANSLKNGKNVIGLVFRVEDNGNQYIDCYINGTTYYPGSQWTGTGNKPYKGATFDEIIVGTETNMSNIELYTMNGKATAEDFASVPEPTALALLALGVAGLALKRKIA